MNDGLGGRESDRWRCDQDQGRAGPRRGTVEDAEGFGLVLGLLGTVRGVKAEGC